MSRDPKSKIVSGQGADPNDIPRERLPLFPPPSSAEAYPVEALGPILSLAAQAIARKVQTAPAIAAHSVLAAASLAAQAVADVLLPYGQPRPLSLFVFTVAATGERKTSADTEALRAIAQHEKSLQGTYDEAYSDWIDLKAAWLRERKIIDSDRTLDYHSRKAEVLALGHQPLPPLQPMLRSAEPTFEGLVKNWPNMHPSLGLFTTEGAGFISGHGMAGGNRSRTAAGLCLLWDGDRLTRVRASDRLLILNGRRLTVHIMVQAEIVAAFLSDAQLRNQGLHSRILVAAPDSIAGTRTSQPPIGHDEIVINGYNARISHILGTSKTLGDNTADSLSPRLLIIGTNALIQWRRFFDSVEVRRGLNGDLSAIDDFAAKAAEHAARIAGILTIVANKLALEIDMHSMECAIKLTTWYLNETLRLRSARQTDPKLLQAQALLKWMQGQPQGKCQLRDILRLGPSGTRTKKDAEAALDILRGHGWVDEVSQRPRIFLAFRDEGN